MRIGLWGLVLSLGSVVAGCGGEDAVTSPARPASTERAPHKVLVLCVTQRGAVAPEAGRTRLQQVFRAVNSYYDEVSYGRLDFAVEFFGWYGVDVPLGTCNLWRVLSAAVAAADAEVDFGRGYSHLVVIVAGWGCDSSGSTPRPPEIRFLTGEGEVTLACSAVEAGHATPLVVVHELGHQLHLANDAGFLACGWQALRYPVSQCFLQRYGDFYTAMGGGAYNNLPPRHFNAPEKEALGFFASGDVHEIRAGGRYTIVPLETRGGGLKALKLRVADDAWIYVEYRRPLGCDTGMDRVALPDGVVSTDVYEGALLHLWTGGASYLFDAGAAAGPEDWAGCALRMGETFVEPSTGHALTVVDRTDGSLTVDAALQEPSTRANARRLGGRAKRLTRAARAAAYAPWPRSGVVPGLQVRMECPRR